MSSNVVSLPSRKKKDDAALYQDRYAEARRSMTRFHDLWRTCFAFYDGRQYQSFRDGAPIEKKAPSYRVRLTENRVAPMVNTAVSKLTQNRPIPIVKPGGVDLDRQLRAKAATRYLWYLDRTQKRQRVRAQAAFWAAITGNGYVRTFWDAHAGKRFEVEADDGSLHDIRSGISKQESFSPFQVFQDPLATALPEARWVILEHVMSGDDVEAQFSKRFGKLQDRRQGYGRQAAYGPAGPYDDEARRQELTGLAAGERSETDYRVLQVEEPPSADFSGGRRFFICDGVELEQTELPGGYLSLSHMKYYEVGGRFSGRGIVEDVLDLQRELNRTKSQILEIRNLHLHPMWMAPKGTVRPDQVVNRPDLVLLYTAVGTGEPKRIDPPPIPQSLYELAADLERAIQEVSGINDVSQGRNPAGVVSGRALSILEGQDSTKMGPAAASMEAMIESAAAYEIWMHREYMAAPVTVAILGPTRRSEAIELHASDFESEDVEVLAGSASPRHPAYQQELMKQLLALGALGNVQQDPELQAKVLEAFGIFGMEGGLENDDTPDTLKADNENLWIEEGRPIEVDWFEDDAAHMRRHLRRINMPNFGESPPETQQKFREHLAKHAYSASLKAQNQPVWAPDLGMDIPALQGQPPPGGAPPPQPTDPQAFPKGQPGLQGGGQPELNGAYATDVSPSGPGVDTFEEQNPMGAV